MDNPLIVSLLAIFGAFFGSFACAQVWRLRARQLHDDRRHHEPIDTHEYRRLSPLIRSVKSDRSQCLSCGHRLRWHDLLPVVSWIWLKGKCRYCGAAIGSVELLAEIGVATVFAVSYLMWPVSINSQLHVIQFGIWLIACVAMTILLIYDAKWYLLPFGINIGLIILGALYAVVGMVLAGASMDTVVSLMGAMAILAGTYYVFSVFGWSGQGDSILGVGLAFLCGTWGVAFLALFLANLLGCIMLIPMALRGTLHRGAHIPFGPFMIVGTGIAVLWGQQIIDFILSPSNPVSNLLML